jgi:NAD(P)H-hydrate epimerase
VLTPHTGELQRLVGTEELDATDRLGLAARWAERWNCVLVLKGMPSVVATPEGQVVVAGVSTPALATAGTGDVLAGMTVGLLAQGLAPLDAALCALHLGGRAAERYAVTRQGRTMLATDVLDTLPYVFAD